LKKENQRDSLLWEKLECLVAEWKTLDADNDAVRQRLNLEITETMLTLFPKPEDLEALGVFWLADMEKYDPGRGSFRNFVTNRLKLRKEDMKLQDSGAHRGTVKENGEKRQRWIPNISLDVQTDAEDSRTPQDQQPSPQGDGEELLEVEDLVRELVTAILLLPQLLNRQDNNTARINYYRMFFTDGTVAALHSVGEEPYIPHERDLFRAMKLPFLDFFLEHDCRTVKEILGTDLKSYGQMVPGRPMKQPGQPLPNDIYMQYLNTREKAELKSPSTITNQRNSYRAFLKETLC